MAKVLIIGGGVAGLSAGIYAQMNGFETTILERHTVLGGECTGWWRLKPGTKERYHIDNCIHWMTGTSPKKDIYKVWETVGALGPNVPIIQNPAFLCIDDEQGNHHYVWQDLKRMKQDMLELSPADADAIERFMDAVDRYQDVEIPTKPNELMNLRDIWHLLMKMKRVAAPSRMYSKMSIQQIVEQFQHPLLRSAMQIYLPKSYFAEALFFMYATFASGNGALPAGGSMKMSERMQHRYEALGGMVRTGCMVEQIMTEPRWLKGEKVTGVRLKSGEIIEADYVIAACDSNTTMHNLLRGRFRDKLFDKQFSLHDHYPLFSSIDLYYAVDGRPDLPDTVGFHAAPFEACGHELTAMLVKHYAYEAEYAPQGKMVMQVMLMQYEDDYDYWEDLYLTDSERYKTEKARIAEDVRVRLEEHFPELRGLLTCVEAVTPYSFNRFCGAYKGAYMSFIHTPFEPKEQHPGRIKGLKNLYIAGQWTLTPGGLPNAVISGKFAVQRLCKDLRQKFVE